MTNLDVVKAYVAAVERFDGKAAAAFMDEAIRFTELPNRIRPKGGTDDKAALLAGLERAASRQLLREQRYHLVSEMEAGDRVVLEARWEGVLAQPLGKLAAGETMVAHICMLFRVQDGRILEQRNYDCYEDFTG